MTWIKIDDGFPNHPKIIGLTDRAFRLHIQGLCYCGTYLTDGFIPYAAVNGMLAEPEMKPTDELEEATLWVRVDGGFEIHDYLEHQTSKRSVDEKRDQVRNRVTRYREKSNADVTLPEDRIQNSENRTQKAFDEFWNIYPRKVGKRDAEKAYAKALTVASAEEILAGAQKYATDPNRVDTFTAHPSTWLNQGRWADDALPPRSPVSRFAPSTTPTPIPPRIDPEEERIRRSEAVSMPDSVRNLFQRISDL